METLTVFRATRLGYVFQDTFVSVLDSIGLYLNGQYVRRQEWRIIREVSRDEEMILSFPLVSVRKAGLFVRSTVEVIENAPKRCPNFFSGTLPEDGMFTEVNMSKSYRIVGTEVSVTGFLGSR